MRFRSTAVVFAAISVVALTACFPGTATLPEEDATAKPVEETAEPTPELGTRETPFPIGTTLEVTDWTFTVDSVNLDATAELAEENLFNEPAAEGNVYILVSATITYTGDNPDGEMPAPVVEYVTADGNTINSYDSMVVTPDDLDTISALYEGASTSGNLAFEVPANTAGDGVLAVRPYMLADKAYVAVK